MERPAFVQASGGRYRSAYSPVPALAAAAIGWPLSKVGVLDLREATSANVLAALSASVLTAAAVVLAFLTARRYTERGRALFAAAALGVGTGFWSTASQTLWQHETAVFGLSLALFSFTAREFRVPHLFALGAGLALAGTARPQLAPAVAALLAGTIVCAGWKRAAIPVAMTGAAAAALMATYAHWFGSVLGAAPILEALHPQVHATERSFDVAGGGFAGLLISPNRGLLIFSPIAALALAGIPRAVREGWSAPLRWIGMAAVAQYLFYGSYAVWWGGHTYGPRYMLDVLPLAFPLAVSAFTSPRLSRAAHALLAITFAWSTLVAGTGAFVYPHERWNIEPANVDRHHERLWDWSDLQILRCWQAGPSPQNFSLFSNE